MAEPADLAQDDASEKRSRPFGHSAVYDRNFLQRAGHPPLKAIQIRDQIGNSLGPEPPRLDFAHHPYGSESAGEPLHVIGRLGKILDAAPDICQTSVGHVSERCPLGDEQRQVGIVISAPSLSNVSAISP